MGDSNAEAASPPSLRLLKPADPCVMVLFGATGDLARRLVVPALYNLAHAKVLPDDFSLIGVARREETTEGWRKTLHEALQGFASSKGSTFSSDGLDEAVWDKLAARMSFVQGDLSGPDLYQELGRTLSSLKTGGGNVIFYLAVADQLFGEVVAQLGAAGLTTEGEGDAPYWRRVVIEKPFGHSLQSARELNAHILETLKEEQIFRIDHFLGKDTVQNIMALRFANGVFEPLWNRDRIEQIQITAAETVGVEGRGDFYERTGALRDMVPNHLLSLLSLIAMEPPTGFDAAAVRGRKADVLAATLAADPAKAVRAQYGPGDGAGRGGEKAAKAYVDEPNVDRASRVETFAALRLEIDTWRWAGVPFFLRTGKHMKARVTEIAIKFKQAPYSIFQDTPVSALRPNWLVLRVAPDESVSLQFEAKRRGPLVDLAPVAMEFRYDDWFEHEPNVGYETLLYDVMIGDPALFMRADMVEQGWRIVQPVLDAWAADVTSPLPQYASGGEGPSEADALVQGPAGEGWRLLDVKARRAT